MPYDLLGPGELSFTYNKEDDVINEATLIPISLVVVIGAGLTWIISRITTIENKSENHTDLLDKIQERQDQYSSDVSDIKAEIQGIHGELRRIKR